MKYQLMNLIKINQLRISEVQNLYHIPKYDLKTESKQTLEGDVVMGYHIISLYNLDQVRWGVRWGETYT